MMRRRRRPLLRATMVGGVARNAGKRAQQAHEQEARLASLESQQAAAPAAAPTPAGGMSDAAIDQLKQLAELKDGGVLTQDEFDEQKRRLLQST